MNKDATEKWDPVQFKDLDREALYKLFINSNTQSIEVEELDKEVASSNYELAVRYRQEKLLFLNLLMDYDLENQIERRKNVRYDYMIGLLLCIASNPRFKYTFGYFKENIHSFDKKLSKWCNFLNAIISDIKTLPIITVSRQITIEFGGILMVNLSKNVITDVKIELDRFDKIFDEIDTEYDFCILINGKIIETGKSNGKGVESTLYKSFTTLNALKDNYSIKNRLLISLIHEL